jgi:hypothetical protein
MTLINTLINASYYVLSAIVSLILIRNIIKTRDAQEAVLYCIILMPFLLRVFHIK